MQSKPRLATALATHTGRVRTNNEDSVAEAPELGLIVLADGMGGHNAGEVASSIAVHATVEVVRHYWHDPELQPEQKPAARALLLERALRTAHERIRERAIGDAEHCAGMGTTATCCLIYDDRLTIAHIGDSRAYRLRDHRLTQLTRDHSVIEQLIEQGLYSRETASRLVRKNLVTRALGVEASVRIDVLNEDVRLHDLFLICSDGLTDMLSDETISSILDQPRMAASDLARQLVDQALASGGHDNVTVAIARVESTESLDRWHHRLRRWLSARAH